MFHSIKKFWLLLLLFLTMGAPTVFGFALLGPYENWQVTPTGFHEVGDDGGPKDLGDGFRWNTRTVFYACDESFANFFGSNGIVAIDKAFAAFNNLTNLSSYTNTPNPLNGPNLASPSGGLVPLSTSRINFTAEGLNLQDVKSTAMSKIINFLGLGQPDRYVWNIENRFLPSGGTCPPDENYVVVQRNFDPADYGYSSFVNGTLYNYIIDEVCTAPLPPIAVAVPVAVDPNARQFTTVADGVDAIYNSAIFWPGRYFTGFTKDDIGGLRYLMATNRMQFETVLGSSLQLITNSQPQLIVTSNLNLFYQQALTNNPAALLAIYTNLVITSTNSTFTNVVTTNIFAIATNILQTAGGVTIVLVTNFTTNAQPIFFYTFANLVIYTNFSNSVVETLTTQIAAPPGISVAGTLVTNTLTNTVIATNDTNGAFYILPADLCSGFANIKPQLTNVISVTNIIPILNPLGLTNTNFLSASIVTFFTNYILVANAVNCTGSNAPQVFEGLDKINFQRVDFDSILGTNWGPVTNIYQLTAITNFTPVVETFRRVATQPDITIEARDGIVGPANQNFITTQLPGSLNFNASVESTDGNGPGTIEPPIVLLFTKGGTAGSQFINGGGAFQSQGSATPYFFAWGSFDGTTNAPIVYPTNSSLSGLESMVFFQVATSGQLNYSVSTNSTNNPFSFQLQVNGGAQPYKWSLVPPNFGLPPGLTLNTNTGVISGVSTNVSAGTVYDFVVQATDSSSPTNRITQSALFITISP